MRIGICNGIVLHDFDVNQVDVKGLFHFMEQWFTEREYPPKLIGYNAQGLPFSDKVRKFRFGKQKLESIDYKEVEYFSMHSPSPTDEDDVRYCIFEGEIDLTSGKEFLSFLFDEKEYSFIDCNIRTIVNQLIEYLKPKYGYAFQREFALGPQYYPAGVIYGKEHFEEEKKQISKWSKHYFINKKYETGQYRDIYPYNIICEKHLEQEVGGKKLTDWIAGDPRHGALTQLKENLWVWNISEENIPLVREALRPTGQVICI